MASLPQDSDKINAARLRALLKEVDALQKQTRETTERAERSVESSVLSPVTKDATTDA
jgi:hypothetical protein